MRIRANIFRPRPALLLTAFLLCLAFFAKAAAAGEPIIVISDPGQQKEAVKLQEQPAAGKTGSTEKYGILFRALCSESDELMIQIENNSGKTLRLGGEGEFLIRLVTNKRSEYIDPSGWLYIWKGKDPDGVLLEDGESTTLLSGIRFEKGEVPDCITLMNLSAPARGSIPSKTRANQKEGAGMRTFSVTIRLR